MARGAKAAIKQNVRSSKGVPRKGTGSKRTKRVGPASSDAMPTQRWHGPDVVRR